MKVDEGYEALRNLSIAGYGNLDLIFCDVRSGDTGSVSIYNGVSEIDDPNEEDMGRLCTEIPGYKYVPVYCDH